VAVPVVPLPREVCARMTVHAAGMLKDCRHLPEFLSSLIQLILCGSGLNEVLAEGGDPGRDDDTDHRCNSHAQLAEPRHRFAFAH
jgi:hypothetical protein